MPDVSVPAASSDAGEAAALMSRRHGWLRFRATGERLPLRLDDDPAPWQGLLLDDHRRWYGPQVPSQVAGAFVLQYLLQVPAQTAAVAASVGLRVRALADLTFERGPGAVPRLVEVGDLVRTADEPFEVRLSRAERDYRTVAEPLARSYPSTRRMGSHQRSGMVSDMWAEAARDARTRAGDLPLGETRRISCCLIYALPGCHECAGCPRRSPPQDRAVP